METIVLFIPLFVFSLVLHAQLKKGQWMIGGTADFSHSHTFSSRLLGADYDSKSTAYRLAPGIGYFFMDRLCGGLRINIGNIKSTEDQDGTGSNPFGSKSHTETKVSAWGISPFLRYYFLPISRKVNIFADAAYSRNDEKTKTRLQYWQNNPPSGPPSASESFSTIDYTSNSFSIAAGPVIFINSKVSFELSLGYTHRTAKKQDLSSNGILFGTGFQVYLNPLMGKIDKHMGKF